MWIQIQNNIRIHIITLARKVSWEDFDDDIDELLVDNVLS